MSDLMQELSQGSRPKKIWNTQNQYFSVPHFAGQRVEKANAEAPAHIILANEPRLKDVASKSQEMYLPQGGSHAFQASAALQHSSTQGLIEVPQQLHFQMQGTSILRQRSSGNFPLKVILPANEVGGKPYADEPGPSGDEGRKTKDSIRDMQVPEMLEADDSTRRNEITDASHVSLRSKGQFSLPPTESRNFHIPLQRSIKDKASSNKRFNQMYLNNMKVKAVNQPVQFLTGQSLGIGSNQDLAQVIGQRKSIEQVPMQSRPRTFGQAKRGAAPQKLGRAYGAGAGHAASSVSPNHMQVHPDLRKSPQEPAQSFLGGGSVQSMYADSVHTQSKPKRLSQVDEQQTPMERMTIPAPNSSQQVVVNITTANINTTNYISDGSRALPEQMAAATHAIPIRGQRLASDAFRQETRGQPSVADPPVPASHVLGDNKKAQKQLTLQANGLEYCDDGTHSLGGGGHQPNQRQAITQYQTAAGAESVQQSIDGLYQHIDYIYKNRSRLNRQINPAKAATEGFKREREGSGVNPYDTHKSRENYGSFDPSELNYADKNYQNYIKPKSKSQKRAFELMNPKLDPVKKVSKKLVDFGREAEIDTILSKIKSETHTVTSTAAHLSPRKERINRHVADPRASDPIDALHEQLSAVISQLTHFDDSLKLKLHLNLELNQQDQKIWKKHASLLGDGPESLSQAEKESNLDHLLSIMQKAMENLFSQTCYHPEKFDFASQAEEQQSQTNHDLCDVVDCVRSLMQKNSITWQMLAQMKGQNEIDSAKATKNDKQLLENLKQNQVLHLCTAFMAILVNNVLSCQQHHQERQKQSLAATVSNIRAELSKKLVNTQKTHAETVEDLQSQLAAMTKNYEDQRKEKMRLIEVTREMENDIKILLEGGRNFFQIRDLMGKLNKDLNQLDESANHNTRSAQIIRGVLENLEEMELEQAQMKKSRRKRKPLPEVPQGQNAPAVLNTGTLGMIKQVGGKAKQKRDAAGGEGATAGEEEDDDVDEDDEELDEALADPTPPSLQTPASQADQIRIKKGRKEVLLEEASKFMTKKELELFKRKIIEPRPRQSKVVKSEGCQTKLCSSKEPFSSALWRMDNPQLAERRDKERFEAMYPPPPPLIQEVPVPAAKEKKSPVSSRIEEDNSSDRSTKQELKSFNKLMGKLNVKNLVRPLPDHAIFRLVDVSIIEMVQVDAVFFTKGVFAGASAKNPPKEQLNYADHLHKFLMTQYGLPVMASGYFEQIQTRVQQLADADQPQANCVFISKLLNLKHEVQESSIEIVESSPERQQLPETWTPLTQRVAVFAKLLFEEAQEKALLAKYSLLAPKLNLPSTMPDQMGSLPKPKLQTKNKAQMSVPERGHQLDEDEVSIFELNENMGKFYPASRITLRMIDFLKPAAFDQFPEDSMDLPCELMNLKFAKMKITAKLAMMNFDCKAFFEKLDATMGDRILLYKLFSKLAEQHGLYFSVTEQNAMRNALFPQAREENVAESRTREVILGLDAAGLQALGKDGKSPRKDRELRKKMGLNYKTFYEVMTFSRAEFQVNLKEFLVSKWDFIDFVVTQWQDHLNNLSAQIEQSFKRYDSLHNRNALNFEQFLRLLTFELRLQFKACFGVGESAQALEEFYNNCLLFYEQKEGLRQLGLIGLDTIKFVVLQKNNDLMPFFKFIANKFSNLSPSQKRNMKQLLNNSKQSAANTSVKEKSQHMILQMKNMFATQIHASVPSDGSRQASQPRGLLANLAHSLTQQQDNLKQSSRMGNEANSANSSPSREFGLAKLDDAMRRDII